MRTFLICLLALLPLAAPAQQSTASNELPIEGVDTKILLNFHLIDFPARRLSDDGKTLTGIKFGCGRLLSTALPELIKEREAKVLKAGVEGIKNFYAKEGIQLEDSQIELGEREFYLNNLEGTHLGFFPGRLLTKETAGHEHVMQIGRGFELPPSPVDFIIHEPAGTTRTITMWTAISLLLVDDKPHIKEAPLDNFGEPQGSKVKVCTFRIAQFGRAIWGGGQPHVPEVDLAYALKTINSKGDLVTLSRGEVPDSTIKMDFPFAIPVK